MSIKSSQKTNLITGSNRHLKRWRPPRPTRAPFDRAPFVRAARTSRALVVDKNGKRNRVRFRLSLASPLRRAASLIPFRRPSAAFRRQRQTEAHQSISCRRMTDACEATPARRSFVVTFRLHESHTGRTIGSLESSILWPSQPSLARSAKMKSS